MFEDYTYTAGDEALAAPGTTSGGWNWEDFINGVIRGTTEIIAVSRQPAPTLANRPTYTTSGTRITAGSSNNMLILAVVIVGAVLLLK